MVVAIDTSALKSNHRHRGTGVYTSSLINALEKYEPNTSYILFTREQKLPKSVDLIHYPYFDPFFLTLPLRHTIPTVVTVHDLIPIVYPEHFPRGIRGEIKWQVQKRSLHSATHIITDSKSSQNQIQTYVSYPIDQISVIYLAPQDDAQSNLSDRVIRETKLKFSLPNEFIVYVGDINWNKNIPRLLSAFKMVREKFPKLTLLLVGGSFLKTDLPEAEEINKRINTLLIDNAVMKTGHVSREELRALYKLALGCVQPSIAEGFGLPVVEAMANGCPCVVSGNTSLAEIAGPSIMVDAASTESISSGIEELMSMDATYLSEKSKAWAKQFTWKNVANKTTGVYHKVLERS